jgi:hypothetical protein
MASLHHLILLLALAVDTAVHILFLVIQAVQAVLVVVELLVLTAVLLLLQDKVTQVVTQMVQNKQVQVAAEQALLVEILGQIVIMQLLVELVRHQHY